MKNYNLQANFQKMEKSDLCLNMKLQRKHARDTMVMKAWPGVQDWARHFATHACTGHLVTPPCQADRKVTPCTFLPWVAADRCQTVSDGREAAFGGRSADRQRH